MFIFGFGPAALTTHRTSVKRDFQFTHKKGKPNWPQIEVQATALFGST